MEKKKPLDLTDAEHRIMEVLWRKGTATVADVAETLAGQEGSAYNTVLTLMRILREKRFLSCRKRGRAHVYRPKVKRDIAARNAVHRLLARFFAGSPGELVLSFLKEEDLRPEELDELKRKIQESGETRSDS